MKRIRSRRRAAGSITLGLVIALVITACGADDAGEEGPQTITLITHDSFAVSPEVIEGFESTTGHTVEILQSGDAGAMVNQAILTKDNPLADVMFGVDNTFLSRALDAEIFERYTTEDVDIDEAFRLDDAVTPVAYGDVCLNYDVAGLVTAGLDTPTSLRDLTDPSYAGSLVVQNPATSSPGLAFLLATVAQFGEDGDYTWLDYWTDLVANDVLVTAGWEDAYYGEFSGGAGAGDLPIVVSYASSPPAEVIFADPPVADAPTAAVTTGCFRQIEFAGILAGTDAPNAARELVDFMVSVEFQNDMPLNMFIFPVNADATLPSEFVEFAARPEVPVLLAPDEIAENRDRWIEEWTEIVLP